MLINTAAFHTVWSVVCLTNPSQHRVSTPFEAHDDTIAHMYSCNSDTQPKVRPQMWRSRALMANCALQWY
jgi:hypothetical protein